MAVVGVIGADTDSGKTFGRRPFDESEDVKTRLVLEVEAEAVGVEVELKGGH
jgi:hypothetical protein